ncbi:MAG: AzlC family ABC transporter permease [Bacteroidota bacterium]
MANNADIERSFTGRRHEFLAGVRDELPILLGVMPFGMIYGALALGAGLKALAAQAMSSVVFAGSAQFITVQLIRAGVPAAVIVLTVFVVNLRHALYSASVAPHLKPLNPLWKCLLAYLLTDEAYAVAITRYNREDARLAPPPYAHWYFLGAGITLWSSWQLSTAVGIFLGAQIPAGWSLDFTLALTFIALVFPAVKDRAGLCSALSAGLVAVLAYGLPYKLGLVLAAFTGIAVGLLAERKKPRCT